MSSKKQEIVDSFYKSYGTDSGIIFGIKERSIVEAIVGFVLRQTVEDKDNFAISFACWLKTPEGKMYEATGISAQALLDKYKDRPFINTFDIEQQ